MSEVEIRQADLGDLAMLPLALGQQEFFADRFARQKKRRGTLLVAWDGGRPVGVVYLWLERAEEKEIRAHLKRVPLLTHLEVLASERGRGIGTMLINEAERLARVRRRRSKRIALAVPIDRPTAAERYTRLGYRDWGHGSVTCLTEEWSPDGSRVRNPERCHVLVKQLTPKD